MSGWWTLNRYVRDVVLSLRNSGIEKIVLHNSHGGNEFQPLLRELAGEGITVFLIDWFLGYDEHRIGTSRRRRTLAGVHARWRSRTLA